MDFHHIFTPSEGVAGDWFDAFPVGNSGVGAIVCDVMGHGIRAALIASMLRGLIEQLSHLADNPAAFLSSLNHQLAKFCNGRIPRCSPPPFIFTWIWKPAS